MKLLVSLTTVSLGRLRFPGFLANALSYRMYCYRIYMRAIYKVFPFHYEHFMRHFFVGTMILGSK